MLSATLRARSSFVGNVGGAPVSGAGGGAPAKRFIRTAGGTAGADDPVPPLPLPPRLVLKHVVYEYLPCGLNRPPPVTSPM